MTTFQVIVMDPDGMTRTIEIDDAESAEEAEHLARLRREVELWERVDRVREAVAS